MNYSIYTGNGTFLSREQIKITILTNFRKYIPEDTPRAEFTFVKEHHNSEEDILNEMI